MIQVDSTFLNGRPELVKEFVRWDEQLDSTAPTEDFVVSAREVLVAHFLVAAYFTEAGYGLGAVGPKSIHLLQSAVARQEAGFGRVKKWNGCLQVAATLFFGLIKNHPFHDANKRTALLTLLFQLHCANRAVTVPQRSLEDLAVRIASSDLLVYPRFRDVRNRPDAEVHFIEQFLRKSTRQLDKREFRVTFRQLEAILGRYGFRLGAPHDNRIEVFRVTEERAGFFSRKTRTVLSRVTTIGFRDWGTEVSMRDLKEVRRATGLTTAAGYDTAVLTQGLNPMERLIAEYSEPLRRLARK